jgi:cell division protein FtsL
MFRIVNAVLLAVMIVAAGITYVMKHQAEEAATTVTKLQRKIAKEKEAVGVLKAEWSFLTQPGRLQALAAKHGDYFKLEPFSAAQLASLDELPIKPVVEPEALTEKVADLVGAAPAQ